MKNNKAMKDEGMWVYQELPDMDHLEPSYMDVLEWDRDDETGFKDEGNGIDGREEWDRDAMSRAAIQDLTSEKWTLIPQKKEFKETKFMMTTYKGERKIVTRWI